LEEEKVVGKVSSPGSIAGVPYLLVRLP